MSGRILIVEDSVFMRGLLKDILTGSGYEIVGEAETAKRAIELYSETKPDLVTIDIILPGEDGLIAVREIIKKDPEAKILIVSAVGQDAVVSEALQSGAKSFITKPFQAKHVLESVKAILGGNNG